MYIACRLDLLFGATIGEHTRHFIEFFQCLITQIESEDRVVDYAKRVRDHGLQSRPADAARAIDMICDDLTRLEENTTCKLLCNEHFDSNGPVSVDSNLEREMLYNIEHTIHHLAIIKIGLATVTPQIELPPHFGVAPSTIKSPESICLIQV